VISGGDLWLLNNYQPNMSSNGKTLTVRKIGGTTTLHCQENYFKTMKGGEEQEQHFPETPS